MCPLWKISFGVHNHLTVKWEKIAIQRFYSYYVWSYDEIYVHVTCTIETHTETYRHTLSLSLSLTHTHTHTRICVCVREWSIEIQIKDDK